MTLSILLSLVSYAVITAYTPGPNNIINFNTTTTYGFKKSNPLRWGIVVGFTIVITISTLFVFLIGSTLPDIVVYLKYLGCAYILYLAVTIIKKPKSKTQEIGMPKFWSGFFLQFVNVKVILYGITAASAFFIPYYSDWMSYLLFDLFLIVNSVIAVWAWGLLGFFLTKLFEKYSLIFKIIMVALLLEAAISILFV